jgi:16S rRNA processing protein RimM
MTDYKGFFYLGKVTKPFGYKGDLVIYIDADNPQDYKKLESVLIETEGELIPFFIDRFEFKSANNVIVHFKDMGPDESHQLVNNNLYLPLSALPVLTGNKFYFHEVIGFTVIDQERGDIGTIQSFLEFPTQSIMCIDFGGKEILIPVIDQFIKEVSRTEKKMMIVAPEGLIDLYIG